MIHAMPDPSYMVSTIGEVSGMKLTVKHTSKNLCRSLLIPQLAFGPLKIQLIAS